VTDKIDSHLPNVSRVVVQDGTLVTYAGQVQETVYTFASKSDAEQTVYLDHPRTENWELTDTHAPHEVTDNFWRFKFPLPPNATRRFTVKARHPSSQSFRLIDTHDSIFSFWVANGYLDAATQKAIQAAFAVRTKVAALEEEIRRTDEERAKLREEQVRIRENLTALGDRASEKDLRERYVRTLGKQEDRLEVIEKDRAAAVQTRDAARQELTTAVNALRLDRAVAG
jgi:hypothetical protein